MARVELVADLIETESPLTDEPAMDPRRQRRLTLATEALAQEGAPDDDSEHRHRDRQDGLDPDRTVGGDEGQQTGRERSDRKEDREEGRAGELEHEERQRSHEPDRVDRHRSESMRVPAGPSLRRDARQLRSRMGLTSVAKRVIDSSSYGDGKPATKCR